MHDLRDPYLLERLRRTLAEDPRVGEPTIRVFAAAGRIWLEGVVASEDRKRAASDVAQEVAPDVEIRNELEVMVLSGPSVESVGR